MVHISKTASVNNKHYTLVPTILLFTLRFFFFFVDLKGSIKAKYNTEKCFQEGFYAPLQKKKEKKVSPAKYLQHQVQIIFNKVWK